MQTRGHRFSAAAETKIRVVLCQVLVHERAWHELRRLRGEQLRDFDRQVLLQKIFRRDPARS